MEEDNESLFTITEADDTLSSRMSGSQSYFLVGSSKLQYLPSVNFIYQRLGFLERCGNVPNFVRSNVQKNAKLTTESYVLRVNYFRRRRETSTDMGKNRALDDETRRTKFLDQATPRRSAMSMSPP